MRKNTPYTPFFVTKKSLCYNRLQMTLLPCKKKRRPTTHLSLTSLEENFQKAYGGQSAVYFQKPDQIGRGNEIMVTATQINRVQKKKKLAKAFS